MQNFTLGRFRNKTIKIERYSTDYGDELILLFIQENVDRTFMCTRIHTGEIINFARNEPPRGKTNNLHRRKQRRRSASR